MDIQSKATSFFYIYTTIIMYVNLLAIRCRKYITISSLANNICSLQFLRDLKIVKLYYIFSLDLLVNH